jgi:hypothetical protein
MHALKDKDQLQLCGDACNQHNRCVGEHVNMTHDVQSQHEKIKSSVFYIHRPIQIEGLRFFHQKMFNILLKITKFLKKHQTYF